MFSSIGRGSGVVVFGGFMARGALYSIISFSTRKSPNNRDILRNFLRVSFFIVSILNNFS